MHSLANAALLFLAISFLAATPINAEESSPSRDAVAQAIAGLDTSITHIRVFGEWKTDTAAGRYRVIIRRSDEAGTIRFFLQQISTGHAIVSSIELTEIAEKKLSLTGYNFDIGSFGLTLFIETRDKKTMEDITYEVFLQDDGSYDFQQASN